MDEFALWPVCTLLQAQAAGQLQGSFYAHSHTEGQTTSHCPTTSAALPPPAVLPGSASPGYSLLTVLAKLASSCLITLSAELWYTPAGPQHLVQKDSRDSFL